MEVEYSLQILDKDETWDKLGDVLGGTHIPAVKGVIRHLRVIGADCYILESRYIDRDYSSDYLRFYAQTFRSHDRYCKRLHFFSADLSVVFPPPLTQNNISELRELARASYCGFSVVRPLPNAPIGRTVLAAQPRGIADTQATVTCRADYIANLFGIELEVTGTAFMQQDARVGSCAQVSAWVGIRHMHARYKCNWVSIADITRLVTPTTAAEAASLPAGSDYLTSERMIRAIYDIGFQPLFFRGKNQIGNAILPYVESGIPVLVGFIGPAAIGHAVTVIGRNFSKLETPTNSATDYISSYIVHDDQSGPYMLVPMKEGISANNGFDADDFTRYPLSWQNIGMNMYDDAAFAIALMPRNVFSTAMAAEVTAVDRIHESIKFMAIVRQEGSINERMVEELVLAWAANEVVLRTYLTSVGGYRRHILRSAACKQLKRILLSRHFPHFVWVTEIATVASYNHPSPDKRRIYGHAVVDATSAAKDKSALLLLHLPSIVVMNDVNARPEDADSIAIVEEDTLYECRDKRQ